MSGPAFDKFKVGTRVRHVGWGAGVVVESDASRFVVEYDSGERVPQELGWYKPKLGYFTIIGTVDA